MRSMFRSAQRVALLVALALVLTVVRASEGRAGKLTDIFLTELGGLELEPLGPALATTVATTYPVASASSSVIYAYNPAVEAFERRTGVLGPIIGERADTIGDKQVNIGLSYSSVDFSTINGDDLGSLVNQPRIGVHVVSFPVPGGVRLADGPRSTNFLPVQVHANLDVEADIFTPGFTYGITPDLDINLTLPLLKTFLGVKTNNDVPDPRLPEFALTADVLTPLCLNAGGIVSGGTCRLSRAAFARAEGVGDLLLRAKYVLSRHAPVDMAVGLGVSFPSGDPDNLQGTGTYRVQPTLILSRVIADRFQPLLNLGIDINADNVDRSIVRWALGVAAQIAGPVSGAAVFLGRHELSAQADQIPAPFFFQIERNDFYDASVGLRYLFAQSGVVSANAILPLNRAGLRADVIPTLEVEYAFSSPL